MVQRIVLVVVCLGLACGGVACAAGAQVVDGGMGVERVAAPVLHEVELDPIAMETAHSHAFAA